MTLCDDSWESPAPGVGAGLDPKPLPLPWRALSFQELSGFSWDLCEYLFYLWFLGSCLVKETLPWVLSASAGELPFLVQAQGADRKSVV